MSSDLDLENMDPIVQYFLNLPAKNYLCSLLNTQISSAVPLEIKWVGLKPFFFSFFR